jgi:hypothetical protein
MKEILAQVSTHLTNKINNMERITTRIPINDLLQIEKLSSKNGVSKSEMTRILIKRSLNDNNKLMLDILIELLMSSRIKNTDSDMNNILKKAQEFKESQNLQVNNG